MNLLCDVVLFSLNQAEQPNYNRIIYLVEDSSNPGDIKTWAVIREGEKLYALDVSEQRAQAELSEQVRQLMAGAAAATRKDIETKAGSGSGVEPATAQGEPGEQRPN
jgi:hypothetical protein